MKRLVFDFETRSTVNLKKAGSYKYSLDPSTKPTCMAFKIRGNPTVYFLDFQAINRAWCEQPLGFQRNWVSMVIGGFQFAAHNAFFERCI